MHVFLLWVEYKYDEEYLWRPYPTNSFDLLVKMKVHAMAHGYDTLATMLLEGEELPERDRHNTYLFDGE